MKNFFKRKVLSKSGSLLTACCLVGSLCPVSSNTISFKYLDPRVWWSNAVHLYSIVMNFIFKKEEPLVKDSKKMKEGQSSSKNSLNKKDLISKEQGPMVPLDKNDEKGKQTQKSIKKGQNLISRIESKLKNRFSWVLCAGVNFLEVGKGEGASLSLKLNIKNGGSGFEVSCNEIKIFESSNATEDDLDKFVETLEKKFEELNGVRKELMRKVSSKISEKHNDMEWKYDVENRKCTSTFKFENNIEVPVEISFKFNPAVFEQNEASGKIEFRVNIGNHPIFGPVDAVDDDVLNRLSEKIESWYSNANYVMSKLKGIPDKFSFKPEFDPE